MLTVPGIDELWTADFGEPHPGEPAEPSRTPTGRVVRRYERPAPGELVHPYIKRHEDPVTEPDCRGWAERNGSPASRHAFWRRLCAAVYPTALRTAPPTGMPAPGPHGSPPVSDPSACGRRRLKDSTASIPPVLAIRCPLRSPPGRGAGRPGSCHLQWQDWRERLGRDRLRSSQRELPIWASINP